MIRDGILLLIFFICCQPESFAQEPWGIDTHLESDEIADTVKGLGVSWVRLTLYWSHIEPYKGKFNWKVPDAQINRARERGLKVYAVVHTTPSWASGRRRPADPPRHSRDWTDFLTTVAQRYGTGRRPLVLAFGMWNEPNLEKFWRGDRNEYIQKILIPGFQAIKSVNPNLLVVAPEMSHSWIDQKKWRLWEMNKTIAPYLDVIGLHYYPDEKISFADFLDKRVSLHREGKDLWITEIGEYACSSKPGSETKQSTELAEYIEVMKARPWFTKIFPYRIWDPVDACGVDGNGFGITYGNPIQERTAYRTYREIIMGSP